MTHLPGPQVYFYVDQLLQQSRMRTVVHKHFPMCNDGLAVQLMYQHHLFCAQEHLAGELSKAQANRTVQQSLRFF